MGRILLIDDSNSQRNLLKNAIIERGHEVEEAINGAEGLKSAMSKNFDLILCDLEMPEMDGKEFLEKAASIPTKKYILTNKLSNQVKADCSNLGAEDTILKLHYKKFFDQVLV